MRFCSYASSMGISRVLLFRLGHEFGDDADGGEGEDHEEDDEEDEGGEVALSRDASCREPLCLA
jgi:hypothetical protein